MTTHRHGPARGTWDMAGFSRDWAQGLSDASRSVVDAVTAETEAIYTNARRLWPVKTGRSLESLGWRVRVDGDTITGQVRAAVDYARYIQSPQSSVSRAAFSDERVRSMHRYARTARAHQRIERLANDRTRWFRVRAYVQGRGGGKVGSKAARRGAAAWVLLRWPEAAAGERLIEDVGPIVEADMQRRAP